MSYGDVEILAKLHLSKENVPLAPLNNTAPPSDDALASPFLLTLLFEKEQFVNTHDELAEALL